mgnify:CR=1 FL=1
MVDETRFKLSKNQPELSELLIENYGISEISYVNEINLISAAIGVIFGDNKWWEDDFVPHFEPLWERSPWSKSSSIGGDEKSIKAYVNPFQTEGLLIELNKKRIVDWLKKNKFPSELRNKDENEVLMKLSTYSEESYRLLETLIQQDHGSMY